MKKNSLGRIGFVFKGTYNNENEYTPMDVVFYDGSSYICTNPTRDNLPTDNNYWNILVKNVSEEVVNSLENRIIDLESELPDKEVEGSNIEIKDGAKARARILPMGNTEQESREGYNLLDVSKLEQGGMTGNTSEGLMYGRDFVSDTRVRTAYIPVIPNTTYLVQAFDTNVLVKYIFEYDENKQGDQEKRPYITIDVTKKTFTTSSDTYFIRIAFNKVGDIKLLPSDVTKAQLVLGTEEKPYEQYGKTPTIELPSPIKVVEGSFESYNIMNLSVEQDSKVTVNDDGTLTINGAGGFFINFEELTLKTGKTYRQRIEVISGSLTGGSIDTAFMSFDGTNWMSSKNGATFTPTEDKTKKTTWIHQNLVFDNLTIKYWAYEGSSDKEFLPYGTIKNTYETKIENKNLFDKDNTTIEIGTISTDGNFSVSNIRVRAYNVNLKEEKEYTTSSSNKDLQVVPYFYDSNNKFISYSNGWKNMPYTFAMPKGASILRLLFKNSTDTITVNDITDLQIEDGNTATDYVEHQEQVKNLDFPEGIQLAKEDELQFNYTEKNGYKTIDRDSVYHIGNTGYIELNGTENWTYSGTTGGYRYYLKDNINLAPVLQNSDKPNILCNMFKAVTMNESWSNKEGISVSTSGDLVINRISNETNSTANFKTWLSKNLPNVRYQLATPVTTQITDETFINQLEDLLNSETYKGITHITTSKGSAEVADLIVKVDYKQSNSSRIDALEKAILSIGGNV